MTEPIALRMIRALLLIVALLFPAFTALADTAAPVAATTAERRQLSETEREAIRKVAAALAATPDLVDRVLSDLGFDNVSRDIPEFADWPTLRKVDAAYKSARNAQGKPDGARFLGRMARIIERDHSAAIRSEVDLAPHFALPDPGDPFIFQRPATVELKSLPSLETQKAILAIERYVDRVPGGVQGIMHACCYADGNLTLVYDTLHAAPNRTTALVAAIQNGSLPREVKERLLRALRQVMERSAAAAYEPDLAHFLRLIDPKGTEDLFAPAPAVLAPVTVSESAEQDRLHTIYDKAVRDVGADQAANAPTFASLGFGLEPGPTPAHGEALPAPNNSSGGAPPGRDGEADHGLNIPGPPTGEGGGGAAGNARRYAEMQGSMLGGAEVGPSPGLIGEGPGGVPRFSFPAMRISRAGPGGVLFGNQIESDGVAKPAKAIWVPDPAPSAWGHLDVVLRTGEVLMTKRIQAPDAYAAWEILTGRNDGGDSAFAPLDIAGGEGAALASVARERFEPMLVHPALYGLELGNAAASADALGFKRSLGDFCRHLLVAEVPSEMAIHALKWRLADKGWYKILDAPLRIVVDGGVLTVTHLPAPDVTPALAQIGFLDFQAIVNDEPVDNPDFTPALPALISAFPEIARLNAFAESFAILRWSKQSGAEISPPPKPKLVTALLETNEESAEKLGDSTTSDLPAQRIAAIEKDGTGLLCLLQVAAASQATLASFRAAIEARKQVERVLILKGRLGTVDTTDSQENAAKSVDRALDVQMTESQSVLERFRSNEGVVAALNPGTEGEALRALGARMRAKEVEVARFDSEVQRLTDQDAAIASLPKEQEKIASMRLASLKTAVNAFVNAEEGRAEDAALAALRKAKAEFVASVPFMYDSRGVAETREKLARGEAELEKLRTDYNAHLKALTPDWLGPETVEEFERFAGDF
jgi:hypothetical protein